MTDYFQKETSKESSFLNFIMNEIILKYRQGKFKECLDKIRLLPQSGDLVDDLVLQNCLLVCESVVTILENNPDKVFQIQEKLYLFLDRVTSLGMVSKSVPSILILNVSFNFFWWLLFFGDYELEEKEAEEYLELLNNTLLTVLGKNNTLETNLNITEKTLRNLWDLKSLIPREEKATVLLICELMLVVLLYVSKLKKSLLKSCREVVSEFIIGLKDVLKSVESVKHFVDEKPIFSCLFKFGLNKMAILLSDIDASIIGSLHLLESALLFALGNFKDSLKSLEKNFPSSSLGLWNYLGVLNSFKLENWDLCLEFATKGSSLIEEGKLKARFFIMNGKLSGIHKDYKVALNHFQNALEVLPNSPIIYYYIGQVYGKMGLYDMMIEVFEDLVKVIRHQEFENNYVPNFETALLDWIHSDQEITESEAMYALATSYVLNENFQKAAEIFENILQCPKMFNLSVQREIQLPNVLTVVHEASITNLLNGNLLRAEQLALEAIDRYIPQKTPNNCQQRNLVLTKDVNWLQMTLQRDLLDDLEPKEVEKEVIYFEDAIYFFSENVIALLILSEIYGIQEVENYKKTLSKIYSIFCKYLILINKKQVVDENEKLVQTLVKALAGKTCLKIAMVKQKENDVEVTDKMFKRALCSNRGDKDALFNYYNFLLKFGKNNEALKLWHTFYKEEKTIVEESVQSFSIRFFLKDKIFKQDLEKIQRKIEVGDF